MANPEHLAILKQGVEQWNEWRKQHPELRPDLIGAYLTKAFLAHADLSGVVLSGASLNEAVLYGAQLIGSYLPGTDLYGAYLSDAVLSGAHLSRADLRGAHLHRADLTGGDLAVANLSWAYLTGAKLSTTNLSNANLASAEVSEADFAGATAFGTVFASVDLSVARGLEEVRHFGPSYVDIHTIYKSKGKIPEVFLRGCGVPEEFIEFARSIGRSPIEFYSCFISYAHEDKLFARRLHDALQGRGVRCWLDEKQMLPGDDIYEQVDRGIRLWDKVLLCCSRHSTQVSPKEGRTWGTHLVGGR